MDRKRDSINLLQTATASDTGAVVIDEKSATPQCDNKTEKHDEKKGDDDEEEEEEEEDYDDWQSADLDAMPSDPWICPTTGGPWSGHCSRVRATGPDIIYDPKNAEGRVQMGVSFQHLNRQQQRNRPYIHRAAPDVVTDHWARVRQMRTMHHTVPGRRIAASKLQGLTGFRTSTTCTNPTVLWLPADCINDEPTTCDDRFGTSTLALARQKPSTMVVSNAVERLWYAFDDQHTRQQFCAQISAVLQTHDANWPLPLTKLIWDYAPWVPTHVTEEKDEQLYDLVLPEWFEYELPWAEACGFQRLFVVFHHCSARFAAPSSAKQQHQFFCESNAHVLLLTHWNQGVPQVAGPALFYQCDRRTNQLLPLDRVDYRICLHFLRSWSMTKPVMPRPWSMRWDTSIEKDETKPTRPSTSAKVNTTNLELDAVKQVWLYENLQKTSEWWKPRPLPKLRRLFDRHVTPPDGKKNAVYLPCMATDQPVAPETPERRFHRISCEFANSLGVDIPDTPGQWCPKDWRIIKYKSHTELQNECTTQGIGACWANSKLTTVFLGQHTIVLKSFFPTLRHSKVDDPSPTLESFARPHCMEDAMSVSMHFSQQQIMIPNLLATFLAQEPLFGNILAYAEDAAGRYSLSVELLLKLIDFRRRQTRPPPDPRWSFDLAFPTAMTRIAEIISKQQTVIAALPTIVQQQEAMVQAFFAKSK